MRGAQLYHEATLVSLLEAVLYHEEACLAVGGATVDLIDYCMRAATFLTADPAAMHAVDAAAVSARALVDMSGQEHLDHQTRTLAFDIAIKAVAILRYITDHLNKWVFVFQCTFFLFYILLLLLFILLCTLFLCFVVVGV